MEETMILQFKHKAFLFALAIMGAGSVMPQSAPAHCQIPCGIYDDYARVLSMLEDAATVEKSVKLIAELSGKPDIQSQQQLVRWVMNKEKHAQNIITTISDYFLTQHEYLFEQPFIVVLCFDKRPEVIREKFITECRQNLKPLLGRLFGLFLVAER